MPVLWGVLSAASFGLMSYLVHWNPQKLPVEQLALVRGLITMAGVLPWCWRDLEKYFRPDSAMLWVRACSGATGLFLYYYTLQGTVSANANFLFRASPLFVVLFAVVFLKERLSRREASGILLIVSAVAFLSLGSAAKKYSSSLIVFGFGFMGALLGAAFPGWSWVQVGPGGWAYIVATGLLGLSAQFLMTLSFIGLTTPIAATLGRSSILFAGLLDIFLSGYRPHPLDSSGSPTSRSWREFTFRARSAGRHSPIPLEAPCRQNRLPGSAAAGMMKAHRETPR